MNEESSDRDRSKKKEKRDSKFANLPVERWNRPRNRDTLRIAFVVPRDIRCDHLSRGRSAR